MIDRVPEPKGWYSRDYLPHFDGPDLVQGITFRLHDSMPQGVLEHWTEKLLSERTVRVAFVQI